MISAELLSKSRTSCAVGLYFGPKARHTEVIWGIPRHLLGLWAWVSVRRNHMLPSEWTEVLYWASPNIRPWHSHPCTSLTLNHGWRIKCAGPKLTDLSTGEVISLADASPQKKQGKWKELLRNYRLHKLKLGVQFQFGRRMMSVYFSFEVDFWHWQKIA